MITRLQVYHSYRTSIIQVFISYRNIQPIPYVLVYDPPDRLA